MVDSDCKHENQFSFQNHFIPLEHTSLFSEPSEPISNAYALVIFEQKLPLCWFMPPPPSAPPRRRGFFFQHAQIKRHPSVINVFLDTRILTEFLPVLQQLITIAPGKKSCHSYLDGIYRTPSGPLSTQDARWRRCGGGGGGGGGHSGPGVLVQCSTTIVGKPNAPPPSSLCQVPEEVNHNAENNTDIHNRTALYTVTGNV